MPPAEVAAGSDGASVVAAGPERAGRNRPRPVEPLPEEPGTIDPDAGETSGGDSDADETGIAETDADAAGAGDGVDGLGTEKVGAPTGTLDDGAMDPGWLSPPSRSGAPDLDDGFGLARNARTRATSSSSRLASADPFPVIPARVQISTSALLSTFSSFANA